MLEKIKGWRRRGQQRMRWLDSITDSMDMNLSKLWKILKEMGIPDYLTCLLRNLYGGQEATVRTGHRTTDWFQIGKGVPQGCILSPCIFNCISTFKKTKIMASSPISSWEIDGETVETVSDFIFWGFQNHYRW